MRGQNQGNKKGVHDIHMLESDQKENLGHAKSVFEERKEVALSQWRHLIICFAFAFALAHNKISFLVSLDQLVFNFKV